MLNMAEFATSARFGGRIRQIQERDPAKIAAPPCVFGP